MSTQVKKQIELEIAHVLFIDIVGYSKLSTNHQHAAVEELNLIVRLTQQFQRVQATSRLLKIPTGDGMALADRLPLGGFAAVVTEYRRSRASDITAAVRRAVDEFAGDMPPFDDFTMVVLKRL